MLQKKLVALVGRPNVGKSTLFNRLTGSKTAIIHNSPGVTRDRKYAEARIGPLEFMVVDTPGLEEAKEGQLEYRMMQQTMKAIIDSDLVCLIVDNITGITPLDKFFANLIRKNNPNYLLIINKSEQNFNPEAGYYQPGFGTPIPVSAAHGYGLVDLHDAIVAKINPYNSTGSTGDAASLENAIEDPLSSNFLQIAVVGRPNSGKSTFINKLLGEERMLTGKEAGITRESVETSWVYKGINMKLIDTAGLRKRSNVTDGLEKLSTQDTINSINFANTVILMLDSTIALEHQDLTIANYIIKQGRSLIIIVNKWDLILAKEKYKKEFIFKLEHLLPQIKGVPILYISALNDQAVDPVLDECIKIYNLWNKKIPTNKLNIWLSYAVSEHLLPLRGQGGQRVKIKYITQVKTRPPTFKLFTNDPSAIRASYEKYLINSLRKNFALEGVSVRLHFTKSNNPFKNNPFSDKKLSPKYPAKPTRTKLLKPNLKPNFKQNSEF